MLIAWGALLAAAQAAPASGREVQAKRSEEAIRVDGNLSEAVWQGTGTDDFTQRNPLDGKPASGAHRGLGSLRRQSAVRGRPDVRLRAGEDRRPARTPR